MSSIEEPTLPGIDPGASPTTPETASGAKRQRAKRAPSASAKAVAVSAENSSRGAGSARTYLLVLLLLGRILGGSDCVDFLKPVYDFMAACGADAYGMPQ